MFPTTHIFLISVKMFLNVCVYAVCVWFHTCVWYLCCMCLVCVFMCVQVVYTWCVYVCWCVCACVCGICALCAVCVCMSICVWVGMHNCLCVWYVAYVCVYLYIYGVCMHVLCVKGTTMCNGKTCRSQFSPSTMEVCLVKLRSPGSKTFIMKGCWILSNAFSASN